MPFESLSERHEFLIADFPADWLPLVHLYDPDLPLYPLLYFHSLDPTLDPKVRAGERDRVFGFIHHINLEGPNLRVSVALNKKLSDPADSKYLNVVEQQCRARLGLSASVDFPQLAGALKGKLVQANPLVKELWYQIVDRSFGKSLPFGQMWDPVLGLVRFIASWNSNGGRKGELIQTHFFAQAFGQRIATGSGIHVDFYLLPTFEELTDLTNPLSLFPLFANLVVGADRFCTKYCSPTRAIVSLQFSAFNLAKTNTKRKLDTGVVLELMNRETGRIKEALFENYSAFNRGPQRSIISLMMIHDLRAGRWHPDMLSPAICAKLYTGLSRSYQTPKVIQLYAQQCFGTGSVLPIDIWIETFLKWPMGFESPKSKWHEEVFQSSDIWGKIERLIWLAAQSRKVHSSVSAEILWCIRYGSSDEKGKMRGANPMSCKICADHIRAVCPAYAKIASSKVAFNGSAPAPFNIATSAGNNTASGQTFASCTGPDLVDEYSARDRPERFSPFPRAGHKGQTVTVSEFIQQY